MIFGICLALTSEWKWDGVKLSGLGLAGAIAINLSGGGPLLYWLHFTEMDIPLRGIITLWIVAILVVGIGLVELISKSCMEG